VVSAYTPSLLLAGATEKTLSMKKDRPSSRKILRKGALLLVFKASERKSLEKYAGEKEMMMKYDYESYY
jgi:hypothetical protein